MSSSQLNERTAFTIGLSTGLILSLYEAFTLLSSGSKDSLTGTIGHIFALNLLFGSLLGVGLLMILPPFFRMFVPSLEWLGLRWDESVAQRRAVTCITSLVCIPLLLTPIFLATVLTRSFNQAKLAGIAVCLAALGGGVISLLCWPRIQEVTNRILSRLSRGGRIVGIPFGIMLLVLGLIPLLIFLIFINRLPLGAYQLGSIWESLGGLTFITTFSILLSSGRARILAHPLLTVCLVVLTCLSLLGLRGWGVEHASNRLLTEQALLSRTILSGLRLMTDGDGDGVSSVLGGGDCDDTNPLISPRAKEIPDNNIDDNCIGGDAKTPPPPTPKPMVKKEIIKHTEQWNVLLLLVDTMRASHLELYGYDRPTMPNLNEWAQDAVVFDRAFAHAPRTPFSIPSILIGRYPSRIDWVNRFKNYSVLKDENLTIFERFKDAGWRTEVVSAHWYFGKKKGVNLNQGVDQWDNRGERSVSESNTQSEAAGITRRLKDRLGALKTEAKPFFIFAHYFAPHGRYMLHRERCRGKGQGKNWCHSEPKCAAHPTKCIFGKSSARGVEKFKDKYDSELAYTDLYLGEVFDELKRLELDQNTIVIVTSDHGESFKDRKPASLFHGRSVYNEELHVPLLIKTPRSVAQRRNDVVGLVDLVPTLTDITGADKGVVDGSSLSLLLDDPKATLQKRTLFLEQLPYPGHKVHMLGAVNADGLKLIRDITNQTWRLYDLNTDWGEQKDLWSTQLDSVASELSTDLSQFIDLSP